MSTRLKRERTDWHDTFHSGGTVAYRVYLADRWVGWVGDGRDWRGWRHGARRWWAGSSAGPGHLPRCRVRSFREML